ncbi:MAG TPA: serine/threonine-protein kinase, partial [Byssovorax sp.]
VYLGVKRSAGARVAIKVLSSESARDPDTLERLFLEARAVNSISHQGIVGVIDLAKLPDGRPYIVMELVDGPTLRAILRDHPLPPLAGIVQAVGDVLAGLAAAHAIGIVHRDLKPENVAFASSGRAKLLDFGIAKVTRSMPGAVIPRTVTGIALGTPDYMAPEQIVGRQIDGRADLYAAGVVLFEAMTGRRPYHAKSDLEIMKRHLEAPIPDPREKRPDLPAPLAAVIVRALAKSPLDRYGSAKAMGHALAEASASIPRAQWKPLADTIALRSPSPPAPPKKLGWLRRLFGG